VTALLGFLIVTTSLNPHPGDVSARAPERARLASLIRVEQQRSDRLRMAAVNLRRQVQAFERNRGHGDQPPADLNRARAQMGLLAAQGPGLVVTLDDSMQRESPSGNLNDLVIHSQDVQAVANGLWAAGAEALAVSGQRVVPTSAVLCVGNTLLINGTVHSPPYRFAAIGTGLRDRFLADPLVQRFAGDADRFELGFSVESRDQITVPAYKGTTTVRFARAD
jgi:uncharacterized protein YlxW (UPF0749 family)